MVIIEYIYFLYCCIIFEVNCIVVYYSIEYHNFPKHLLIIGHLGCLCHFAIVNNTVMNNFCMYNLFHILGDFLTTESENKVTGPEIVMNILCAPLSPEGVGMVTGLVDQGKLESAMTPKFLTRVISGMADIARPEGNGLCLGCGTSRQ